ncbi:MULTISPECIES: hypothetical protein [unclassified Crossiella]|nr:MULTISPECIES: hypothetical protein [unclassified Crossiella]MCK2241352.1 hypothetical protein [Crossiella sp. S99.2]MCK2253504.1 hypothetical protein [Crossiella sp. S99.1]
MVGTAINESLKCLVVVAVDTDGDRGEMTGSIVVTNNHFVETLADCDSMS